MRSLSTVLIKKIMIELGPDEFFNLAQTCKKFYSFLDDEYMMKLRCEYWFSQWYLAFIKVSPLKRTWRYRYFELIEGLVGNSLRSRLYFSERMFMYINQTYKCISSRDDRLLEANPATGIWGNLKQLNYGLRKFNKFFPVKTHEEAINIAFGSLIEDNPPHYIAVFYTKKCLDLAFQGFPGILEFIISAIGSRQIKPIDVNSTYSLNKYIYNLMLKFCEKTTDPFKQISYFKPIPRKISHTEVVLLILNYGLCQKISESEYESGEFVMKKLAHIVKIQRKLSYQFFPLKNPVWNPISGYKLYRNIDSALMSKPMELQFGPAVKNIRRQWKSLRNTEFFGVDPETRWYF